MERSAPSRRGLAVTYPTYMGGHERYIQTPVYLVGRPGQPLTDEEGQRISRGYFQYMSNLEPHVSFCGVPTSPPGAGQPAPVCNGRMAGDVVSQGPRGPVVEAVLGRVQARLFQLKVGDVVTMAPSVGSRTRVSAKIVGILEVIDPTDNYWHGNAYSLTEPQPLGESDDPGIEVDAEEPPIALFITKAAMISAVGDAYRGTLVTSNWFISVDKERLKDWSASETRKRLRSLEHEMSAAEMNASVLTGMTRLLDDFEKRSFFSSVPLLLLLTIMVITVLYYQSMMISYLVQSREADVAILKSRGVSMLQLLRLYALEGLVLTVVAVVLAPFVAMGAVALAGKLPYFREITGGGMLPVEFNWVPFAVAAGAGVLSLALYTLPGLVGARTGLVIHKLRSSRPPSVPFYQRYYLDVGLLVVGGLVFWELHARGQFVSGGLFKDVQVNEALLLAPVLFLTVVALMFMRFFPLFVRFISGESPALLHLVFAATLVSVGSVIAVREVRDGSEIAWIGPVALLGAIGTAYWAAQRFQRRWTMLAGLVVQAALVAAMVSIEPPESGETSFVPIISLIVMVPAQVVFLLLRASARVTPVAVSMGLWHMARNPLQYTWLVLLLVLVTGLGILATTVGGTLDQSHNDRIRYNVAADIRVSGLPRSLTLRRGIMKERYLSIPGVTGVSTAYRERGRVGTGTTGPSFELLAVETQDFPYISWWRDDFSVRPLGSLMSALRPGTRPEPLMLPDDATTIRVWANPARAYELVFLWMVLRDANGALTTVSLGKVGDPGWHLMSAELPRRMRLPVELAAVQIFEPGLGPTATPGAIMFDDIHVTTGENGEVHVLEDFEEQLLWSAVETSMLATDRITGSRRDAHRGDRSGLFAFGKETNRGVRGFYMDPTGGPIPVIASVSFMEGSGARLGDSFIVSVNGNLIRVAVQDTVNYFPTMDPHGLGFILADLDAVLDHVNTLSPLTTFKPNELFIDEAPGAAEAVREVVSRLAARSRELHDKDALLEAVRLDPLVTAGWRAMVPLSMAIIVFSAGLGYVTYLLSFADRSRSEMGFLQSLGLSHGQVKALLGFEHLVIVVIGLALGTWAGFQMSALMVSAVAVTETGARVVPPFILITDWSLMLPIYAALAAIFLAALYRLTRSMLRLELSTISRLEG